jgi:hypothetical protein
MIKQSKERATPEAVSLARKNGCRGEGKRRGQEHIK